MLLRKILFSRVSFCVCGIIIQLFYLGMLFWTLGTMFSYSIIVFEVIGFCVAVYIINMEINPSYKILWLFTVLTFPIFGCMLFFFYGHRKRNPSSLNNKYSEFIAKESGIIFDDPNIEKQVRYIKKTTGCPTYSDTVTSYYPNGETAFKTILSELEKAEHFIFLEYFIIEEGIMWNSILEILQKKAEIGIEVRVIYDDMGCLLTLPRNYYIQLENKGIKCRCFGRLKPLWSSMVNNRDHKKMLIVDGKTAFTGGINLADEYINAYPKHGYWKDSVLMLKGKAVDSFSTMFLKTWDTICGEESTMPKYLTDFKGKKDGVVIPFMDSPVDTESVGENIYLNMIASANKYLYITTPYLILDNEMISQLVLAAKNGIDVRIITPHIPDKKFVFYVTRANYFQLIRGGVKIYEFTSGFIHAKNMLSDDKVAIVGTINLDYRSFYLHYECGVWLYETSSIKDIKQDFSETFDKCIQITENDCHERNIFSKVFKSLLKLFSPLM